MSDVGIDYVLRDDPKHLGFTLARYKFVAKMFSGYKRVLEIGCGNGIGAAVIRQHVGYFEQTDEDILDITVDNRVGYDGVFCLDVIEHITKEKLDPTLWNLCQCAPVCIIGTPSLESQVYASKLSRENHVNCMGGETLREVCQGHWKRVFMFGMNDESVHTGFLPMSHYLIALCVE